MHAYKLHQSEASYKQTSNLEVFQLIISQSSILFRIFTSTTNIQGPSSENLQSNGRVRLPQIPPQ